MVDDKPIKLTWPQTVWAAAIVFILGGLYVQMDYIRKDIKELTLAIGETYSKEIINEKNVLIWEHIKELESTVYGKVKPK